MIVVLVKPVCGYMRLETWNNEVSSPTTWKNETKLTEQQARGIRFLNDRFLNNVPLA